MKKGSTQIHVPSVDNYVYLLSFKLICSLIWAHDDSYLDPAL